MTATPLDSGYLGIIEAMVRDNLLTDGYSIEMANFIADDVKKRLTAVALAESPTEIFLAFVEEIGKLAAELYLARLGENAAEIAETEKPAPVLRLVTSRETPEIA